MSEREPTIQDVLDAIGRLRRITDGELAVLVTLGVVGVTVLVIVLTWLVLHVS